MTETFEQLLDRLYPMDFEVTKYDWLLVIKNYRTKERYVFHNATADEVQTFIDEHNPIFIAHNGKYYDQYILKSIIAGFDINEIKSVNDHIINGGQGFEIDYGYVKTPPMWDTIQDVVPPKSLKEIEANLCMNITESTIDFDIDHKWTDEEYEEMLYYCDKDVDAIFPLFDARLEYFETKYGVCVESNISPEIGIGYTNARLVAMFLGAKKIIHNDKRNFKLPNCGVSFDNVPKEILDFYNQINDLSIPDEKIFGKKKKKNESRKKDEMGMSLSYVLDGVEILFKLGGQHSARPNYMYNTTNTPDRVVVNVDFSSLYPHLLALPQYNYISRNISDPNKYFKTLQDRLKYKKEGNDKKQKPLKLVLNSASGAQDQETSEMYDPRNTITMRIVGQILLMEMAMRVMKIEDCSLVQTNTDGLMVEIPRNKLQEYYDICDAFSKECGIGIEYDIIKKIIQRDVNNYIVLMDNNKIKAKGGCFSALPKLEVESDGTVSSKYKPNFKSNSLSVVSEALAKCLLFDIPVEDTINAEMNIWKFQIVSHLGSTYEKCVQESPNGDIKLQRNNRIYAGKKPSGKIIKVKYDGRRDSLANCPVNPIVDNANHCTIDDVNKEWYIKLAKQWVDDFKGVKRLTEYKKTELVEMATNMGIEFSPKIKKDELIKLIEERNEVMCMEEKMVSPFEEVKPKSNLVKKINDMKKEIMSMEFVMDQVMPTNLGGGEYASIGQYYRTINELSVKYGLLFEWEVVHFYSLEKEAFKPSTGMPQHIATVECKATFVDIDTGDYAEYYTIASGSDTCDKAVSGASALAFRNWFDKNFTPKHLVVDEFSGLNTEVSESKEQTAPKVPTYIPPAKKEEITNKVVETVQHEKGDDEDIKEVIGNIMKVRELSGNAEWGAKTLESLMSGEISSADILEISLKVSNKLESLEAK